MSDAAATASPAEEVVQLVAELCAAVEARSKAVPALALVLSAFFLRLGRLRNGLAHLVARVSAGTSLPARKPRPPAEGALPRVRKPSAWPTKFRALAELLGEEAAQFADRLRAWLADPDAIAYIVANPGIGRYLRPLCRTLGVRRIPELRRRGWRRAPRVARHTASVAETPSAEPARAPAPLVAAPPVVPPLGSFPPPAPMSGTIPDWAPAPLGSFAPPPPVWGTVPAWTPADPGPAMAERHHKAQHSVRRWRSDR